MDQMRSLIDSITLSDIVLWAMIVLAAGFIGQFGRTFAKYLIDRSKTKTRPDPENSATADVHATYPEVYDAAEKKKAMPAQTALSSCSVTAAKETKEQRKLEKKTAKARAKQKKKAFSSE